MGKVQIFDTHEEMYSQIGDNSYESNLKIREILSERWGQINLEYKETSGFNERIIKSNEETKKEKPWASTFSPEMIALPADEWKRVMEQHPDIGKDLELTALVNLCILGDKYDFEDTSETDLGVSYSGHEVYEDVSSLVQAIKDTLPRLEGRFYGAKVTPVFYTINEEGSLIPDHISNDVEGFMEGLEQEADEDDSLPEEDKVSFLGVMREFASCKDQYRGFNEEERQEFENLFYLISTT